MEEHGIVNGQSGLPGGNAPVFWGRDTGKEESSGGN